MIIKQSTINIIASIAFLLMALLLGGSVYFAGQAIQEHNKAVARQAEFKQLGINLADASDYLTDEARRFAVTGDIKHLKNYWNEIEVTKTRDNVLTRLKELKAPQEEFDLLNLAKQNSDALVTTETRSMRLVLEAQEISKSSMHSAVATWQLSEQDGQLSAEQKMKVARTIMFDDKYDTDKDIIMEPIAQFQQKMNARAAKEVQNAQRKTQTATVVLVVVVLLIVIGMGSVLWVFWTQLSIPVARYISELQGRNAQALDFALTPTGTQELHLLAKAFNQQFSLNQQQLIENRQLIEDIVQVSQGLAKGNLRVKPKAEYQGDFAHIRNAIETTLDSLRQVIEDIVRVSQGLAEGKLHVMPHTGYRGDFIQIKNALESASIKLAKTTAKNTEQNWLQTGQTQLNDKLSGEQNIVQLSENVINFITPYVDAQVGAFYLFEECLPQPGYLRMIASHSYMWRKHLANEFQLGKGLVGQAALERKTIIITEPPENYIYIQSGLGGGTPHTILVMPFLYEEKLKGVIEVASFQRFTEVQIEFLNQVMTTIGIAVNTAESRSRMQVLLQKSETQAEELQKQTQKLKNQQKELQQTNEELQSQSAELQAQQDALFQTNQELEERTRDLEQQKEAIREKNLALEKTQQVIEAKAKELELASKYKSKFLANMSHELRTPLNSLLILAQMLADNKPGNLTDKQVEYARTIHSAGSDLLALINDILDLSKVEAGKMTINPQDMQLTELVNTLEQKFHYVAEEKGLDFHIIVADNLPPVWHTDTQRLQQIINNLLSNAFKFTAKGEIKLTIQRPSPTSSLPSTFQKEELTAPFLPGGDFHLSQRQVKGNLLVPAKTIAISVIDTGIGIPRDKQQLIFDAFQQVDGTTSRRYGGTGLGLSISRQLARLLEGELQLVHSEENKGSTFTLYIPESLSSVSAQASESSLFAQASLPSSKIEDLKTQPTPTPVLNPSSKKESLGNTSTETEPVEEAQAISKISKIVDDREILNSTAQSLLIIEDDRKFSNILIELAREKGFQCIVAEDGNTGLQLAEKYQPNAIILDVGLPQLNGWQVMESLKDNPKMRHIPVHFMSAFVQVMEAKKMGAIGYLLKPVNMQEVGEAFNKIEQFITKTVKKLLIIVDNQSRQQNILELVNGKEIQTTLAKTVAEAIQTLHQTPFDCLLLDIEIEQGNGLKLLEQIHHDMLSQFPIIVYTDRELTVAENQILQQCEEFLTIKAVKSQERLLDEVTLFLHQLEANLPKTQRQMLQQVHDKQGIFKHKKVLIVDDDMRNVYALTSILEDKEMEVFASKNGKKALTKLDKHPDIDIVLMDIMMPEMDGYETMQQIRKQSRFQQLPIIALTAKAMKGDKAKCIEAGANDYLSKPIDTDKLISLIQIWLYR